MVGHIPYAKGMGNLVKIKRGMGKNKKFFPRQFKVLQ